MKRATWIRFVSVLAFVAALEIACRTGVIPKFTMIPPSEMFVGLWRMLVAGKLNEHLATTLSAVLTAAVSSIVAGFIIGAVLHSLPRVRRTVDPLFAAYYAIPVWVFYPLFIVLFGLNQIPIVVIAFLYAVVAMIVNMLNGLDRVPRVLSKTAQVMHMGSVATALLIILPYAVPYIFTGVKLAIAYAFLGVIGSEFILSGAGIGYSISYAYHDFDNISLYAMIVLVLIIVSTVNSVLFAWERVLMRRRGLA